MKITGLILMFSIVLFTSCSKDEEVLPDVQDLTVNVRLMDVNNEDAEYFDEDDDIKFYFSISNTTEHAIGFYFDELPCQAPEFGFKIYNTTNNNLVGTLHPIDPKCTLVLKYYEIAPGEVLEYSRTYFEPMKDDDGNDVINNKLPKGFYYTKFKGAIVDNYLDDRNLPPIERPVSNTKHFVIQ